MTKMINLNSKRPPVIYTVTIVHHYDDTLEFRVEDVEDDPRSREAVMSAFRRVSGAEEEIENLRADLRQAIFSDLAYTKEIERQDVFLREENARLREALEPFAAMELWTDTYPDGPIDATIKKRFVDPLWVVAARAAAAALKETGDE